MVMLNKILAITRATNMLNEVNASFIKIQYRQVAFDFAEVWRKHVTC